MKRRLIFCLIGLALMVIFCAGAYAAEYPGGHMPDIPVTEEDLMVSRDGYPITVSGPASAETGTTVNYTCEGSDNAKMAVMGIGSTTPQLYLYYEYIVKGSSMDFTFYEPGTYYIYAWDTTDSSVKSGYYKVTVTGTSYLTEKVEELVVACNAAADTVFEKALWVHDYLTKNAYYDLNMSWYGAAGVLLESKGVCDSYSRAYELLMDTLGVDCIRQSSSNHSWNAVTMDDGNWYWVDCTMDDPTGSDVATVAESGYETRRYFGLSDELLTLLGTNMTSPVVTCSHMEYNYYIKSGETAPWHEAVETAVQEQLAAGETSFTLTLNGRYELGNGRYYNMTKLGWATYYYTLSAYLLDGSQRTVDGSTYTLKAVYDPADPLSMSFSLEMPTQLIASYNGVALILSVKGISAPCAILVDGFDTGYQVPEDGTCALLLALDAGEHTAGISDADHGVDVSAAFTAAAAPASVVTLPSDLTVVESEAFCGLDATIVVIPAACTSLASRAFADCTALDCVLVAGDCSIAVDAFDGCADDLEIIPVLNN